jgi:hypothetical protein
MHLAHKVFPRVFSFCLNLDLQNERIALIAAVRMVSVKDAGVPRIMRRQP